MGQASKQERHGGLFCVWAAIWVAIWAVIFPVGDTGSARWLTRNKQPQIVINSESATKIIKIIKNY